MQTVRRPNPIRWVLYAWGAGLPARHREWVLFDVTTRTWVLRHFARATVQLAPFAVLLYVFIPGESWVRAMAVLGGLLIGYFYSFAYVAESAEHRAVKAGYPRGTAAGLRAERNAAGRAEARQRYEERWRD
ncbi:DUF5313 family protein [Pseudonocardia oroxyli]|uniref:DUF5313 family protein n=1 Tax=Pseudonocardia oroxyli TaxID=366584 RepID=UPI001FE09ED9|nr:DUF5313 family protein [Pseudonocardia oroxyli]